MLSLQLEESLVDWRLSHGRCEGGSLITYGCRSKAVWTNITTGPDAHLLCAHPLWPPLWCPWLCPFITCIPSVGRYCPCYLLNSYQTCAHFSPLSSAPLTEMTFVSRQVFPHTLSLGPVHLCPSVCVPAVRRPLHNPNLIKLLPSLMSRNGFFPPQGTTFRILRALHVQGSAHLPCLLCSSF